MKYELSFSRRDFLRMGAALTAAGITIPEALAKGRQPYIAEGEVVSYVGMNKYPAPCFVGGRIVAFIGEWDGVGYPVTLRDDGYPSGLLTEPSFYDFDLVNFNREIEPQFWQSPAWRAKYPNLHAVIRERRFGEDPIKMWRWLGYID